MRLPFFLEERGIVKDALIRRLAHSAEIGEGFVVERAGTPGPAWNDPRGPVAFFEKAVVSETGRREGCIRREIHI
jgi:hypothetical protein